ncbi:uncharacterized protein LOC108678324 [Hyalella azteca]|uniref:Uncharacterized protein LOC108678324 n=1 Tax=Hyalella azteca TaxID=294128 RepID=A0A8B7P897_HYAAZ|nr:uncharacterized protein LOC108678324 [Hyalella azteca]
MEGKSYQVTVNLKKTRSAPQTAHKSLFGTSNTRQKLLLKDGYGCSILTPSENLWREQHLSLSAGKVAKKLKSPSLLSHQNTDKTDGEGCISFWEYQPWQSSTQRSCTLLPGPRCHQLVSLTNIIDSRLVDPACVPPLPTADAIAEFQDSDPESKAIQDHAPKTKTRQEIKSKGRRKKKATQVAGDDARMSRQRSIMEHFNDMKNSQDKMCGVVSDCFQAENQRDNKFDGGHRDTLVHESSVNTNEQQEVFIIDSPSTSDDECDDSGNQNYFIGLWSDNESLLTPPHIDNTLDYESISSNSLQYLEKLDMKHMQSMEKLASFISANNDIRSLTNLFPKLRDKGNELRNDNIYVEKAKNVNSCTNLSPSISPNANRLTKSLRVSVANIDSNKEFLAQTRVQEPTDATPKIKQLRPPGLASSTPLVENSRKISTTSGFGLQKSLLADAEFQPNRLAPDCPLSSIKKSLFSNNSEAYQANDSTSPVFSSSRPRKLTKFRKSAKCLFSDGLSVIHSGDEDTSEHGVSDSLPDNRSTTDNHNKNSHLLFPSELSEKSKPELKNHKDSKLLKPYSSKKEISNVSKVVSTASVRYAVDLNNEKVTPVRNFCYSPPIHDHFKDAQRIDAHKSPLTWKVPKNNVATPDRVKLSASNQSCGKSQGKCLNSSTSSVSHAVPFVKFDLGIADLLADSDVSAIGCENDVPLQRNCNFLSNSSNNFDCARSFSRSDAVTSKYSEFFDEEVDSMFNQTAVSSIRSVDKEARHVDGHTRNIVNSSRVRVCKSGETRSKIMTTSDFRLRKEPLSPRSCNSTTDLLSMTQAANLINESSVASLPECSPHRKNMEQKGANNDSEIQLVSEITTVSRGCDASYTEDKMTVTDENQGKVGCSDVLTKFDEETLRKNSERIKNVENILAGRTQASSLKSTGKSTANSSYSCVSPKASNLNMNLSFDIFDDEEEPSFHETEVRFAPETLFNSERTLKSSRWSRLNNRKHNERIENEVSELPEWQVQDFSLEGVATAIASTSKHVSFSRIKTRDENVSPLKNMKSSINQEIESQTKAPSTNKLDVLEAPDDDMLTDGVALESRSPVLSHGPRSSNTQRKSGKILPNARRKLALRRSAPSSDSIEMNLIPASNTSEISHTIETHDIELSDYSRNEVRPVLHENEKRKQSPASANECSMVKRINLSGMNDEQKTSINKPISSEAAITSVKKVTRVTFDLTLHEDVPDVSLLQVRRARSTRPGNIIDSDSSTDNVSTSPGQDRRKTNSSSSRSNDSSVTETSSMSLLDKDHSAVSKSSCASDGSDEFDFCARAPPRRFGVKQEKQEIGVQKKLKAKRRPLIFVNTEADVSRDSHVVVSSDEDEEAVDESAYDKSFVDDDIQCSQVAGTDMRAVYLRSVRSPAVKSKRKLDPRGELRLSRSAVCSQPYAYDDGDDDSYAEEDDTFVVPNDCVEYETQLLGGDVEDSLMVPRPLGKNNAKNRKRIIALNSSSSDENS